MIAPRTPPVSSGDGECPEAFAHGPADSGGRCPWCKRKYTSAYRADMVRLNRSGTSLDLAYRMFYDPDWGVADIDYLTD